MKSQKWKQQGLFLFLQMLTTQNFKERIFQSIIPVTLSNKDFKMASIAVINYLTFDSVIITGEDIIFINMIFSNLGDYLMAEDNR